MQSVVLTHAQLETETIQIFKFTLAYISLAPLWKSRLLGHQLSDNTHNTIRSQTKQVQWFSQDLLISSVLEIKHVQIQRNTLK